ncbi:hypothetical protein BaRGS_00038624, partial [Batillaria attramentaria]
MRLFPPSDNVESTLLYWTYSRFYGKRRAILITADVTTEMFMDRGREKEPMEITMGWMFLL